MISGNRIRTFLWLAAICLLSFMVALAAFPTKLEASLASPLGEISLMGSYSRTNYGSNSYATHKRYSSSIGLNITPITEIELGFTNVDSYYNDDPFQTAQINEQILSLSLIQYLTPKDWYVQFYAKGGAAQYNRRQKGTIQGIPTREVYTKSPSGLVGAGLQLYLGKGFSLKMEGTTYIPDLHFTTVKDNFSVSGGLSWRF